ncbi:hypothetical protein RUM43_004392 [Polyplax serrata]|uniref:Uncharacterized protein n=1 Tax=Polyplax serrata TaxID=468196 RepID=A0AAN8SCP3_POLSC
MAGGTQEAGAEEEQVAGRLRGRSSPFGSILDGWNGRRAKKRNLIYHCCHTFKSSLLMGLMAVCTLTIATEPLRVIFSSLTLVILLHQQSKREREREREKEREKEKERERKREREKERERERERERENYVSIGKSFLLTHM